MVLVDLPSMKQSEGDSSQSVVGKSSFGKSRETSDLSDPSRMKTHESVVPSFHQVHDPNDQQRKKLNEELKKELMSKNHHMAKVPSDQACMVPSTFKAASLPVQMKSNACKTASLPAKMHPREQRSSSFQPTQPNVLLHADFEERRYRQGQ